VYVFADGPKEKATENDKQKIEAVRVLLREFNLFPITFIFEAEVNLGLADSIINGVSKLLDSHETVIVVEDDLDLSPYFLDYMNRALDCYRFDARVISIGACNFFGEDDGLPETFFLPVPDCWGWATWKNRWLLFEKDAAYLLNELERRKMNTAFNLQGAYDFMELLRLQVAGKVSSWAIRWQAVAYLHGMLCLYPKQSVANHLESEDATHAKEVNMTPISHLAKKHPEIIWQKPGIHKQAYHLMRNAYAQLSGINLVHQKKIQHSIWENARALVKRKIRQLSWKNEKLQHPIVSWEEENNAWVGNYRVWAHALALTDGYNNPGILEKTRQAIQKVRDGEAVFERDSVLLDQPEYPWELINFMMRVGYENKRKLQVVDFGGSLGSTYFQVRNFLKDITSVDWRVVEQKHIVDCGKKEFSSASLNFFYSVEDALSSFSEGPIVLILSGVIQYLEKPYEWMKHFMAHKFDYILFDKTLFSQKNEERIVIQNVPENIYKASYPCWILDITKLETTLGTDYNLSEAFNCFDGLESVKLQDDRANFLGLFFERNKLATAK
jgi:putative methyltransferase (TIGR04325 family)